MPEFTFSDRLFGDKIIITILDADEDTALPLVKEAYKEGLRLQKIFSLYDKDSELSTLNRKRKLKCSEELLHVITNALRYCELTKGKYDISLGKLFKARKGKGKETKLNCTYKDIKIKEEEVILDHEDTQIDLDSIAKGYIVDKVVEYLKLYGIEAGIIDGRGDIRAFGDQEHEIDIQHPRKKDSMIHTLKIKNRSIATSGDYNQYKEDFNTSHIINNNLASVTVITKTLEEADVLATALSVMPIDKSEKLIKDKQLKAVTIDKNMNKKTYNIYE